ncbi:hypothetical protein DMTZ50_0039 [Dehalococcoides mccartyi]|nr:hypothetical protein [Dehalococcoides mccartyi]
MPMVFFRLPGDFGCPVYLGKQQRQKDNLENSNQQLTDIIFMSKYPHRQRHNSH